MSESAAQSTVKRALEEIRNLKARLRQAEGARNEPIAIVGAGLRLPGGVTDLDTYERLLWSGEDAITGIPADRWDVEDYYDADADAAGRMTTRFGGFVDNVRHFDADFFGIAPEEARSLDPQQRLLMELCWEALENAAIAPSSLRGSRAGVYVGIGNGDFGRAIFSDLDDITPYHSTGSAFSVAAGRVSYFLGLRGPAITVDTACSSSLVSLHLAVKGLRDGECDLALAGGVNLILTPEMNIAFSKGRMMSADGRCKTFDAAADGYVRGEGGGVVALKRLSDAEAAGDRILAVIRATAINQDGRSAGLTAPNGVAQEDVIRAALAQTDLSASDVSFVEAHGTGTPLGDPIEVGALVATYGRDRAADHPLMLTSAKTVIGHLEAAAGVAGLAKAVIALGKRELPPHLNFSQGNPEIDWSAPITVPTKATPLPASEAPLRAGLSSFGFSGTNAHVILESAPERAKAEAESEVVRLLPLSAHHPEALKALAGGYAAALDDTRASDAVRTAATGRAPFRHRLAVTGTAASDLAGGLGSFTEGRFVEGLHTGTAEGAPRIAFLFSGQGGQHPGMARQFLAQSKAFRTTFEKADAALRDDLGLSLIGALDDAATLARTDIAQPALVAMQCALTDLWRASGIAPAVVMGHSLGELGAAYAAGILTLEDAVRAAAARGRLLASLPAGGAMGSASAPRAVIEAEVDRAGGDLHVAARNSAESVTLSGTAAAIETALKRIAEQGGRVRALDVPFAAHSAFVDPVRDGMADAMKAVTFGRMRVPVISTVTAKPITTEMGTPGYWADNMRQTVRFDEALSALFATGITHAVEIGPHPMLLSLAAENPGGDAVTFLPSAHRDRADFSDFLDTTAQLFVGGADPDWAALLDQTGAGGRRVALPTYPFQRRLHWTELGRKTQGPDFWGAASRALDLQAERGPLDLNAASYPAKYDCLARITRAVARKTLVEAGLFAAANDRLTLEEVREGLNADPLYRHLLERWLEGLTEDGHLEQDGDAWTAPAPLAAPDMEALWAEADRLMADNRPLLDYVRHCADLAPGIVRGQTSPLETLFPGGAFDLAEALYERSATMRYINGLARSAAQSMAASLAPGQMLNVLEIGAGTGGTSSSILAALPEGSAEYTYSDVTEVFLDRGKERFGARPGMIFKRLDMEGDFADQGFAPGSYDLILAANAIHASTNLEETLKRVRSLLRPGGLLMLVESTVHLDYFDMTTGLIEGWQHFDDSLRDDQPLLDAPTWRRALAEAGFAEAGSWPADGSVAEAMGQHVLLAQQPGRAAPKGARMAETAEAATTQAAGAPSFADLLAETPDYEWIDLLRDRVRDTVIRVLGRDPADPPGRNDRLMDLGMDSLMAIRLRKILTEELGLGDPLPASVAFDHPSIEALATFLLPRIGGGDDDRAPEPAAAPAPAQHEVDISEMSDEEVEALLLQRVSKQ